MPALVLLIAAALVAAAQDTTTPGTYVPGVTYQAANPNYPVPNPFYFEGKIDWELLKITAPKDTWEYAQRGIHRQDDLEDYAGAMDDYRTSLASNSLQNGTCQIVSMPAASLKPNLQLTPPPCMFTVRLRLANLIVDSDPDEAIRLYREVLQIDPLKLEVNALVGAAYRKKADQIPGSAIRMKSLRHAAGGARSLMEEKAGLLEQAVLAYQAELALSPVDSNYTALTGDMANNAHVHWELSDIYQQLGKYTLAAGELKLYLAATQWHSDTYPWRIDLAKKRLAKLQAGAPRMPRPVGVRR